jgi:hypothetical protein
MSEVSEGFYAFPTDEFINCFMNFSESSIGAISFCYSIPLKSKFMPTIGEEEPEFVRISLETARLRSLGAGRGGWRDTGGRRRLDRPILSKFLAGAAE